MDRVMVGHIELCYDDFGEPAGEPLLLIHGLGGQLISWDEGLCAMLETEGFRVVRYDNRDAGKSTILGDEAAYTLEDMADDAVGLLDALGIDSAHVAGVSLGAMIGQTMAVRHPARVRSLCSIMGSTGAPDVGQPSEAAMEVLGRTPPTDRQTYIDTELANHAVIGSRGPLVDDPWRKTRFAWFFDRGLQRGGEGRNLAAIFASGDRTAALAEIDVPTVVIHGEADTLVEPSGGRATASAIAGSTLIMIPDMGHELPPRVWDDIVDAIVCNARRAGMEEGTP